MPTLQVWLAGPHRIERYAQGPLLGRFVEPDLSPRDHSIVTLAVLIPRNQTIEVPDYFNLALDNGVRPSELAFYSGWANAMSAVAVVKDIFAERGIGADQLPAASPELFPIEPQRSGVQPPFRRTSGRISGRTRQPRSRNLPTAAGTSFERLPDTFAQDRDRCRTIPRAAAAEAE
jgi:alkylhydroperoxidase/carboxymuconolactone decarboxylase family protein YurZ